MELKFERGDPARPAGHAILYFTDSLDTTRSLATYIVLLPVIADLKKYVPPFLAGQIEGIKASDLSAFAFPPAPEPVEGASWLKRTAEARNDDLIYGGTVRSDDTATALGRVSEAVAEYARRYASVHGEAHVGPKPALEATAEQVDDVVYGLMGEADLLAELTTLVGRLRYAAEGGDLLTIDETKAKALAIARRLPDNRRVARITEVAANTAPAGAELAQLYLERAYCLYREDYLRVRSLDTRITDMESRQP